MARNKKQAAREFRRMMAWIAFAAVVMVAGALIYLSVSVGLTLHMVIATVAGVFIATVLGCGLFALAFFSDKSGYDQHVTDTTASSKNNKD